MLPVLFRVFGFPIHSYGVMLAAAFLFGLALVGRQARLIGDDPNHAGNLALWILVPAMIGARLFHCLVFWEHYVQNPLAILNVREGGLVFYGGLIGGTAGGLAYMKRSGLPAGVYADFVAPAIALGLGLARIGCLLAGCCHGKACPPDFPLALTFPPESAGISGIPLYPTQPAEAAFSFLIFFWLYFRVLPRKRFHGQVMASFFVAYGLVRSGLEFFRDDPRGFLGLFSLHAAPGLSGDTATGLWKALLYTQAAVEESPGVYRIQISESQALSVILFGVAAFMFIVLPKICPVDRIPKSPGKIAGNPKKKRA